MISFIVLFFISFLMSHQALSNPMKTTQEHLRSMPNFSKHINHPGQDLIFDYSVEKNVTLYYALCDRNQENQSHHFRKQCAIILEQLDRKGHFLSKTKTCISELVSRSRDTEIPRKYRLERLGRNDLVFIWKEGENAEKVIVQYYGNEATLSGQLTELPYMEEKFIQEYLRVRIIHMESCKFHETNVTLDVNEDRVNSDTFDGLNLVKFSDGVEIHFRNYQLCDYRRCRIAYNFKTHQFSDYNGNGLTLPNWFSANVKSIWSQSSMTDPERLYLIDHRTDGRDNLIMLYDADLRFRWYLRNAEAYFTSRNEALICRRTSSSGLQCVAGLYHEYHSFRLDLILQRQDFRFLRLRKLPNDKLILLICYGSEGVTDRLEQFDIVKVDANDHNVEERFVVKNFECKNKGSRLDADFFYKKGFEYCYYINCVSPKPDSNTEDTDFDDFHWYFHSFCMPMKNAEHGATELDTN